MKRFFQLLGFMIIVAVIYAVGAYDMSYDEPVPTPAPVDETPYNRPTETIQNRDDLTLAVVEVGISTVLNFNNDPLHVYIRYPQFNNAADSVISEWAYGIYNNVNLLMQVGDSSELGEINVQFDSFLVDNRYAGVLQSGMYSCTLTGNPEEIVKSFNVDLTTGKFLTAKEIFDPVLIDSVFSLLRLRILVEHPDTDGYIEDIDERWLSHIVIGTDGIIVLLPKSDYFFPEYFSTMAVTLPYEDLGSALLIRTEPPLTSVPTPEPAVPPSLGVDTEETEPGTQTDDDEAVDDDFEPEDEQPATPQPKQTGLLDPTLPMIALTFDDGTGAYIDQFLDLLEQYGARATFCVIGNLAKTNEDALRRAIELDCAVIGHSWDHRNLAKMTESDVRMQLVDTQSLLEEITGVSPILFRPPYGATSDTLKSVAEELGMSIVNWTLDSQDWMQTDADYIYAAVMEQVSNKNIILSHEIYETTLEAYSRLIPDLLTAGYQLVSITELLRQAHGRPTPGQVYYNGHRET